MQNTETGGGNITLEDLSLQQGSRAQGIRRSTLRDDFQETNTKASDSLENAQAKVYEITAQDRLVQ